MSVTITDTSRTSTLDQSMIHALSMIGRVVTVPGYAGQFKVYSVEGRDWYAFDQEDGTTKIDCHMPVASWISFPVATIIPSGHKIGDGFSETIALDRCRVGINLDKPWV